MTAQPGVTPAPARLRLYVARDTPNSARAELNLRAALASLGSDILPVEIVDVFAEARRAVTDGVIMTPTLIALKPDGRSLLIGDLSDKARLDPFLRNLLASPT